MSREQNKIVFFEQYCPRCKYEDREENEDPCWDCLDCPINQDTHRPVKFEEAK